METETKPIYMYMVIEILFAFDMIRSVKQMNKKTSNKLQTQKKGITRKSTQKMMIQQQPAPDTQLVRYTFRYVSAEL